ncbi:pirin family protein [Avibacterium volantium]|uniref:Quercetin 2,3-dioxygenase n=1 Tax=Avibacterium volantium TaxID=762 RepID=A0A447SRC2_AVIVO|nr:pirin family protein [Avibacterium volantium]VEB24042.1 Quercetin 2,3-dioxygenase [Avibacterium volantium]
MRTVNRVYQAPQQHWVGDGFYVSPLFSHSQKDKVTSPFLMLDYAMPMEFKPHNGAPRGVGAHPHAGFETVTIALQGEVEHRDSDGNGGVIGSGDVQWMTAGNGIVHQEFHSENFSRTGGMFEMLQLWVNLPAKDKNAPAGYQSIKAADIPTYHFADNAGTARIIAGELDGVKGPARTFTELNMWEMDIKANHSVTINVPETHHLMLVALRGSAVINDSNRANPTELVIFNHESGEVKITAGDENVKMVLLSGVPIDEPIAAYGPFVMNTREELIEKFNAFNKGEFGDIH